MFDIYAANSFLSIFLYFWWFLFAVFFAFFIPGDFLIYRLNLKTLHRFTIGFVLGAVLWGFQGFIFGYLNARWLSYIYLLVFFVLWLRVNFLNVKGKSVFPNLKSIIKTIDPLILVIIFFGVFIQISVLALMGIKYSGGIYFCCGAIGDFLYHLGLTYQVIQNVPPFEYDLHGVYLTNYHYWGNLVVAELVRVFSLPLVFTQFQYLGIILSLLLGLLALVFSEINKLNKSITRWLIFLLYFSGDFIYIVILLLGRGLNFSMGPLENGASFLNNPPRAFAVVVFFAGLSLFSIWIKKKDLYSGILMAILFGSLVEFKVYVGIFALSGLAALGFFYLVKKNLKMILPIALAAILSLIIYLPVNKNSGGLFFTGFWRFEEFIVQPALGLSHLELARRIYFEHKSYLRVLQYEFIFMFIFFFTIFGPKLAGLFQTKKTLALLNKETHIFLITGIVSSLIAGSFFWQKSGGSNSFNFLVSVYIFGSIYAAIACWYWINKINNRKLKTLIIIIFVAINLPRILYQEYTNIDTYINKKSTVITNDQLEAMEYIRQKTNKNDIVFMSSSESYFYSFIGERDVFLGAYRLLASHDVDTSIRQKIMKDIFNEPDPKRVKQLLRENNIQYLYLSSGRTLASTDSLEFLKPVFKNNEVWILKVNY